jgi:hypothetical protein
MFFLIPLNAQCRAEQRTVSCFAVFFLSLVKTQATASDVAKSLVKTQATASDVAKSLVKT